MIDPPEPACATSGLNATYWDHYDTEMPYPLAERRARVTLARAVCETCPLLDPCRAQGISNNEWGVWGGQYLMDGQPVRVGGPKRRRPDKTERQASKEIEHGTYRGYARERYRRLPICDACRDAKNAYQREHRKVTS